MFQYMKTGIAIALATAAISAATARETTAPDILLISGDDLGTYLGCYGDPTATTPNMDKIASEGVRFDNAWVTQASCSPSRSSIMTGLYPHQNGQIGLAHLGFSMSREWQSIPSILNKNGYYTGLLNKLHIKPESAFPFHFWWKAGGAENRSPVKVQQQVQKFLQEVGDKPFFLHASFSDPHRPFLRDVDGSPEDKVTTAEITQLLPFMRGFEEVPGLLEEVAGYYTCINRMDECVKAVTSELDKAGRLDETLIIIIGDHGAPFGRGKVTSYNPSLHIPFIVKWPGVSKSGAASDALVSTIDILPTILDAVGITHSEDLPGVSLRTAVSNPESDTRDYMFAEFTAHLPADYYPNRTVRNGRFQLIHNLMSGKPNPTPGIEGLAERKAVRNSDLGTSRARAAVERYMNPPEFELFDLQNDPDCFVNLAGDPEHKEIQDKLTAELKTWRQETEDPLLKKGEIKKVGEEIKSRLDTKFSGVNDKPKKRRKK